jgi:hypothetical protein
MMDDWWVGDELDSSVASDLALVGLFTIYGSGGGDSEAKDGGVGGGAFVRGRHSGEKIEGRTKVR